ncbi:mediator of RNA polymerase II transcription subunit 8 [Trichomonascus vanleenenianus]|uniref:RNA polymerase II mediator complex subunit MED8 n=1 Tax=Trichomonascus vanleenenianus TaxID=2268995 RepID=UPI003ECA496F
MEQPEQQPDLSNVPVAALESLRLRLAQLAHSLNSLSGQVQQATLPSWPGLQSQFNVLLTQLSSLSATITGFSELLQKTVAYPLPNFPTATQSGLLTTLLRKKNLPDVEEWIKDGNAAAENLVVRNDDEFTSWAANVAQECQENHEWTGFLTRKEVDEGETDSSLLRQTENDGGWTIDETIVYLSRGEVLHKAPQPSAS